MDISLYIHTIQLLPWVLFLVGVIGSLPYITIRQMKNDLLKGDISLPLKDRILFWVPLVFHDAIVHLMCVQSQG